MFRSALLVLLFSFIFPAVHASADTLSVAEHMGQWALERLLAENDAAYVPDEKTFFSGIDSLQVSCVMGQVAQAILPEQRVKDRFELMLRGYGVPLSDSPLGFYLELTITALWNEHKTWVAYCIGTELREFRAIYRNEIPYQCMVAVWSTQSVGYAGRNVVKRAFLEAIEIEAERVANLYLSANAVPVTSVSKESR